MRLPSFQYLSPGTVKEALETIAAHKGKVLIVAGGTDIVNRLRQRLVSAPYVMSLKAISELKGIKKNKGELVISAGTTLREVAASPEVSGLFPALSQSASCAAAPPIRNMATIGGNLLQDTRCLFYNQSELFRKAAPACLKQGGRVCAAVKGATRCLSVYQGDLAPALIACNAKAVLKKAGSSRTVQVADIFSNKGKRPLAVEEDELLTRIVIPIPSGPYSCAYEKLRLRKGLDYPFASAAAFLSLSAKGVIDRARVVLGACGPAPVLVEDAAAFLVGRKPGDADGLSAARCALKVCRVVENVALPASYRKKMAVVMAGRAIGEALGQLSGAGA